MFKSFNLRSLFAYFRPASYVRIGNKIFTNAEYTALMRKDVDVSADGTTVYIGKGKSQ